MNIFVYTQHSQFFPNRPNKTNKYVSRIYKLRHKLSICSTFTHIKRILNVFMKFYSYVRNDKKLIKRNHKKKYVNKKNCTMILNMHLKVKMNRIKKM